MLYILLSITGVIRILLSILFFYYLIKVITRWLEISSENRRRQNERVSEEGEMILRFNKKGERIKDEQDSEYIDYEDVK